MGVGTKDVEGTACATGLLLDLLADVWRVLHRNTSKQKTEIPCLKQAGFLTDLLCFRERKIPLLLLQCFVGFL